ncbi:MAG: helix-turn-helix transcriptional regulator [Streptococcus hyointestinalis]|uniref:helix-turn-helix domain-containing protein n=1 Tax=Streptococcus hyointestinalis TaxID=1337 RepID=UPI0023F3663F|nr:helix-turn-helix transcriptional regulator [Streptococcus hyointestinalis]MCI6871482.1 helix-turn-helix domain-containing protein [Streptococcus hyointestinalis]MDD7355733.1 helix-turn-helix transcriptional regulator [Streptococcus hyointestinalis]MDY4554385.1 helix-turn-helix transcriptional regulator [Streptococcus hyointestinalis]
MDTFNNLQSYIAMRVKQLRKERHISQEKLSEMADLGSRYIFYIENQKYNVRISTLEKIIKALDISVEEFFEFEFPIENSDITNLVSDLNTLPNDKQSEVIQLFRGLIKNMK